MQLGPIKQSGDCVVTPGLRVVKIVALQWMWFNKVPASIHPFPILYEHYLFFWTWRHPCFAFACHVAKGGVFAIIYINTAIFSPNQPRGYICYPQGGCHDDFICEQKQQKKVSTPVIFPIVPSPDPDPASHKWYVISSWQSSISSSSLMWLSRYHLQEIQLILVYLVLVLPTSKYV